MHAVTAGVAWRGAPHSHRTRGPWSFQGRTLLCHGTQSYPYVGYLLTVFWLFFLFLKKKLRACAFCQS